MSVTVESAGENVFRVHVDLNPRTEHVVTVHPSYAERISPGEPLDQLVRRSFAFLLEREPNTSILRRFDLQVISRYFPDYERLIGDK